MRRGRRVAGRVNPVSNDCTFAANVQLHVACTLPKKLAVPGQANIIVAHDELREQQDLPRGHDGHAHQRGVVEAHAKHRQVLRLV